MNATGQPFRVAHLVESLQSGGAEALAVDIAGSLADRGHVSHLIVLSGTGPFRSRLKPGVSFHDLDRPRRDGAQLYRIIYFLEACRRLEALLRAERIEILQTHLPKANYLGLVMAWRGVCRVYATVHNNREFDYGDAAGTLKQKMRRFGYRQMLKHCSGVIAVSDQVRRSLIAELGVGAEHGSRVQVVTNGVDIRPPLGEPERMALRSSWGAAPDEVLIVAVGRLTAQKNFGALLDALALLPSDGTRWRCVVAGEGDLKEQLDRQIIVNGLRERVLLAGLVQDVADLLAAADIFCLPSQYEGLPLVLLEAMAAALPVVAFAIDGVTDVVEDGVQSKLAPPGDIPSLAGALAALVDDAPTRHAIGAAGRARACERHGFDRAVSRLESLYAS